MSAVTWSWLAIAATALVGGVALPFAAARMLVPALESGPLVENHRGRPVALGLGLVWLVWALGLLALQTALDVAVRFSTPATVAGIVAERVGTTPLALPLFAVPFLLVAGAVSLGLADDVFGASGPKGFRGHLGALLHGRLTTGMLKLLGIGVLALFYGAGAAPGILARSQMSAAGPGWFVVAGVLAALTIALAANLLNLLDLRPGRALKAYTLLVPVPATIFAVGAVGAYNDSMLSFGPDAAGATLTVSDTWFVAGALVVVLLGPVAAVWRIDLGERAMLGDAGANALGAVLGYLLTAALPLAWLAGVAAFVLALNLASERVSFTAVIERVGVLRRLDSIGRLPAASDDPPDGVTEDGGVGYHAKGTATTGED